MQREITQKDTENDDLAAKKGEVSDESMEAVGVGVDAIQRGKTGQDHSTENHEKEMPRSGVGAIQDSSLIKEDIAHIEDASDRNDVTHLDDGE